MLVAAHPLRERLRTQLMLALYRSDRQSEALAVYREARAALVDQLGIEPGQGLRNMEAAILRQDPSLDSPVGLASADSYTRTLIVVSIGAEALDPLLTIAEPLARRPLHELVLVRLVQDGTLLESASRAANDRRTALVERQVSARAVAFTSSELAADVIRLARSPDVVLLLVDAAGGVLPDGLFEPWLAQVLGEAPCDIAILADTDTSGIPDAAAPVVLPFGGAQHEWAAAEIAAWIAGAEERSLELVGAAADPLESRRDASRLLASVALLVQQVAAVDTKPTLLACGPDAVVEAVVGARAVVIGLPDDWSSRGLGGTRADLVRRARVPTLLVRGGLRPGGLAPAESMTRFTWTLSSGGG
jgi:hypothetical protein